MCYLIAKKYNEEGCIAVKAERGKELACLVSSLGIKTLDKGIQILTITDMDIFGEYKPYNIILSEEEFISKVLSM
ncbi:MAG: hypothetical protein E7256_06705 [Lachnospiraceae bacterium]|nr:hypothetical protein [Lachnospiraceae bacterium]